MHGRTAGLFAACALGATAFLIPTELAPQVNEATDLSLAPLFHARHQLLTLPCSECAFSSKQDVAETTNDEDARFWAQGGANSIALNFTVSRDGRSLEVNGEPIYPMGLQLENMFRSPKTFVNQVSSAASLEEIESGEARVTPLEITGHGVAIIDETVVSDDGDVLIPIRYSIFELERQPVSLYEATVQLLKTVAGDLAIVQVDTMFLPTLPPMDDAEVGGESAFSFLEDLPFDKDFPFHKEEESEHSSVKGHSGRPHTDRPHSDHPRPGHHPSDHPASHRHGECNMPAALCKLRHMIEGKVNGMRKGGCHGRKHGKTQVGKVPGHIKPHFSRPGHEGDAHGHEQGEKAHGHHQGEKAHGEHHHGRPHHMRPHGHHHGHHKHHFFGAFRRGLAAVFVPTMAGVAVGMAASLVGLVIGRFLAFLWIRFYRGGRRGNASAPLEGVSTEKEVLIEEGIEVLPAYEEAPAYEDAAKEAKQ